MVAQLAVCARSSFLEAALGVYTGGGSAERRGRTTPGSTAARRSSLDDSDLISCTFREEYWPLLADRRKKHKLGACTKATGSIWAGVRKSDYVLESISQHFHSSQLSFPPIIPFEVILLKLENIMNEVKKAMPSYNLFPS